MNYAFLILFSVTFGCFGTELGYSAHSPWWTHFSYMFQHASVWHLLLNSFAFWSLFRLLRLYIRPVVLALLIIGLASGASWVCSYSLTVVGASGMVYVMLGLYLHFIQSSVILFKRLSSVIINLILIAANLILSFLRPDSAALLHLICLVGGFVSGYFLYHVRQSKS